MPQTLSNNNLKQRVHIIETWTFCNIILWRCRAIILIRYSLCYLNSAFKIMWAMKPTQYLGVMCSLSWASLLLLLLLLLDVVLCGRLLLAFYIYCGCQSNQFSLVHYIKDNPHIYNKKKIIQCTIDRHWWSFPLNYLLSLDILIKYKKI